VASTRLVPPGHAVPPQGLRDRRPWRVSLGRKPAVEHCLQACVFAAGLVAIVGGAMLWLFSMLLTAPAVLAGLWIWSWEFVWARRLLHRFKIWLRRFWKRVRRRPRRWAVVTALGVLSGAAAYWAWLQFGPF
jgi:hypothetical protein